MIKFFIGTDANNCCLENQVVLEYSIKKHCSVPYEIHWMYISNDPKSFWYGWNTQYWSTPFSGFRYGIAEFCGFQGKAIYQDDDQMWLSDPKELWDIEIPKDKIMTGKRLKNGEIRHCVSLIDCEKFGKQTPPASRRKHLPNFCDLYKSLTFPYTHVVDGNFNNFDGEDQKLENIKCLHMTDIRTQPGVKMSINRLGGQDKHWYNGTVVAHPRKDVEEVFKRYYEEAKENGFTVERYIKEEHVEYKTIDMSAYKARNGWSNDE